MSDYTVHTLPSGKEVHIRPMTWDEYWQRGEERLEVTSILEGINITSAERKEYLCRSRAFREKVLQECVENWEEIKGNISFADVVALERLVDQVSMGPVLEGNSSPAAAITATEIKPSIAEPA